jgi:hypothetical protein
VAKRVLLAAENIPHVLQLLLLGSREINAAVVQLLEVLFQHNEHAALVDILHTGIVGLLLLSLRAELSGAADEDAKEVPPGATLRAVAVGRLLGALLKAEVAVAKDACCAHDGGQVPQGHQSANGQHKICSKGDAAAHGTSAGTHELVHARSTPDMHHGAAGHEDRNEGGPARRRSPRDACAGAVMCAREQMLRVLPVALILQVAAVYHSCVQE